MREPLHVTKEDLEAFDEEDLLSSLCKERGIPTIAERMIMAGKWVVVEEPCKKTAMVPSLTSRSRQSEIGTPVPGLQV